MLDSLIFEYRQVLSNKVDSVAELSAAFFFSAIYYLQLGVLCAIILRTTCMRARYVALQPIQR